jgi:hypothetical protein
MFGLNLSGSGNGPMMSPFVYDNGLSGSVKGREFIEQVLAAFQQGNSIMKVVVTLFI